MTKNELQGIIYLKKRGNYKYQTMPCYCNSGSLDMHGSAYFSTNHDIF